MERLEADVVVIGSGIGGMCAARVHTHECQATISCKAMLHLN